ncbi:MAG: hypothetical protein DRO09_04235 [Thermoprotei archaeon]|nr:MAG: hypothetical protein DRO09_04235 [Thermoprotei archaeon]
MDAEKKIVKEVIERVREAVRAEAERVESEIERLAGRMSELEEEIISAKDEKQALKYGRLLESVEMKYYDKLAELQGLFRALRAINRVYEVEVGDKDE